MRLLCLQPTPGAATLPERTPYRHCLSDESHHELRQRLEPVAAHSALLPRPGEVRPAAHHAQLVRVSPTPDSTAAGPADGPHRLRLRSQFVHRVIRHEPDAC